MDSTLVVVILAAIAIVLIVFRTRKGSKTPTVTRRHWEEYKRSQEEESSTPESEYYLKDVNTGGIIHLSLPKGLEEDFSVIRRDRIDRPDDQIEYNLMLSGIDPDHPSVLAWWVVGIATHAWLLEEVDTNLDRLGTSITDLESQLPDGDGAITYRDSTYDLARAGTMLHYEGGRRPGSDLQRWTFLDERGTKSIVIDRRESEDGVTIYSGQEIWLRDLTVRKPSEEAASPSDSV
jgi:hypothetical protein